MSFLRNEKSKRYVEPFTVTPKGVKICTETPRAHRAEGSNSVWLKHGKKANAFVGNLLLRQLEMNFQSGFKENSHHKAAELIFSIVPALQKRKGGGQSARPPLLQPNVFQQSMPGASLPLTSSGNAHSALPCTKINK